MLIGPGSTFRVRCDLDGFTGMYGREWLSGRLCFLLSEPVGNCDVPISLSVAAAAMSNLARNRGGRAAPELMTLPAVEVFKIVDRSLFEDDQRSDEQVMADWDEFSRFLAVPRGLESFDGWKAFLIEDEQLGRYIWKGPGHDEDEVLEANLAPGEFDDAIEASVAFIDSVS